MPTSPHPRNFEFRRKIDSVIYRYQPCEPINGHLAWKREDLDLWLAKVDGFGWVGINAEREILCIPWAVAVEDQGDEPPTGIWVSRKGDKSYVYELVFV